MKNSKSIKSTEKYIKKIFTEDGPKSKSSKPKPQAEIYGSGGRKEMGGGMNVTIPVKKNVDVKLGSNFGKDGYGSYGGYSAEVGVRIPIGKKKKK
jgi:hypothetical protein